MKVFLIEQPGKPQDLLINLNHEGVHFDIPLISAEYLDCDFHMYVYETHQRFLRDILKLKPLGYPIFSYNKYFNRVRSKLEHGESKWPP